MAFGVSFAPSMPKKRSAKKPQLQFRRWKILRGDTVMINTGSEKGLTGTIRRVFRKINQVIVEGRNLVKKHIKKSPAAPKGGVITKETPIHVSNVNLVDPVNGRPVRTRVGYLEDGTKVRVSTGRAGSGSVIPRPAILSLRRKPREDGGPKNTLKDAVLERTYDAEMKLGCHPSQNFFVMHEPIVRTLPRFPVREINGPRAYDVFRNLNNARTRQPHTPSLKERRTAMAAEKAKIAQLAEEM